MTSLARLGLAAQGLRTIFNTISAPMELAKTQAMAERKLERVFKTTGSAAGWAADEIKKFAAERQNVTNFGDEATIDAAAILGSFTNIQGNVFKEGLVSAQDLSAFLGTDLQSSIIMVGKALNDPARGLTSLGRAGIQFSDSQKEQIKTLQETGKVAEAQAMILKELQTQFGGQAEALVDPITQAKNAWGDAMEVMGAAFRDHLLPVMPKLIEGIQNVSEFIGATVGRIKEMIDAIDELALHAAAKAKGVPVHELREAVELEKNIAKRDAAAGGVDSAMSQAESAMAAARASQSKLKPLGRREALTEDKGPFELDLTGATFGKNMELQAEKMLAGIIRDGLQAMTSGVMSLGGPKKEDRMESQARTLEQGSQEAFDVLRANVGGGKDDIQKKQLAVQEKQLKALDKIAKETAKKPTYQDALKIMGIDDSMTF